VDDIFYLIFEDLYQGTHEQKYPFNVLCDGWEITINLLIKNGLQSAC
jgi:hypothetical protein